MAEIKDQIQGSAQKLEEENSIQFSPVDIFFALSKAGELLPPWWSTARDIQLRKFWKQVDHLSGTIYSLRTKISTHPYVVVPRNPMIRSHRQDAESYQERLKDSEFGQGFEEAIGGFVEDILSQDNGGFLEIIGEGNPNGPIVGEAISIAHLDSARCTRTGNPIWPVVFENTDGSLHRFHHTRVLFKSQMSSTAREMNGVGLCAVSRVANVSQNMLDLLIYKQEEFGSRPARQIISGSGVSAKAIVDAFRTAELDADAQGLSRYAKTAIVGRASGDLKLDLIKLSSLYDNFDEKTAVDLIMFSLALGFGMDPREIWPVSTSGGSKADSLTQHLKGLSKGPAQLIQIVRNGLESKFLPSYLMLRFDVQDDQQDHLVAQIREMNARATHRAITAGVLNVRTARLQMLERGEISDNEFEAMELEDGRLYDGQSVLSLFRSDDPKISSYLKFSFDPLTVEVPTEEEIRALELRKIELYPDLFGIRNKDAATQAIAAIDKLLSDWESEKFGEDQIGTPRDAEDDQGSDQDNEQNGQQGIQSIPTRDTIDGVRMPTVGGDQLSPNGSQ